MTISGVLGRITLLRMLNGPEQEYVLSNAWPPVSLNWRSAIRSLRMVLGPLSQTALGLGRFHKTLRTELH